MNTILTWILILLAVSIGLLYFLVWLFSHNPREAYPSELKYFTNDGETGSHMLPERNSPASDDIYLSIVIPCYNETSRLKGMLIETVSHLEKQFHGKYEILIVDDGSTDGTAEYALKLANELELSPHTMRVIKFVENRGKGGAVCHGLQIARGEYVMFADADGASKFSDMDKLVESVRKMDKGKPEEIPAVAVGSRAHMVNTDAVVKRAFIRNLLMYGLHTLVYIFGIRDVKDTQCGFKLFNKAAVKIICPLMHTEGWIFDVEMLILAERRDINVSEVPISWHEVKGSKMVLARDSLNMGIDLVVTRMAYILGVYSDKNKNDHKLKTA